MEYRLWKNNSFAFFLNRCLRERNQILFLGVLCIIRNVNKISNFSPKPWTNPFGKMPMLWVFETDVFIVQKGFFAIWTAENCFLQFNFTIYYIGIQGLEEIRMGHRGLKGVTGGYKGWQGVTAGDKGLHGVIEGYKGLQGVTRGYRKLQGVTGACKGWQGITRGYRGLQGVTGG